MSGDVNLGPQVSGTGNVVAGGNADTDTTVTSGAGHVVAATGSAAVRGSGSANVTTTGPREDRKYRLAAVVFGILIVVAIVLAVTGAVEYAIAFGAVGTIGVSVAVFKLWHGK